MNFKLNSSAEWNIYPLGEVAFFLDNLRKPVKESERISGPYPYYGANGQQGNINGYLFDEPLLLLAEDGGYFGDPIKKIAYLISGKTWVNNHAHVLRAKKGVSLNYLCRVLENYDVRPFISGTTRAKLTKSAACKIPIPLPPLEEQKRIADILDKADDLRQKRQQAISKLDELLQSVFLDMFGDPVTNPKGWEIHQLKDLCNKITDGTHQSPTWSETGIPFLFVSNIKPRSISFKTTRYISLEEYHRLTKNSPIETGDILYTVVGSYGNAALVNSNRKFAFQRHIAHIKPGQNILPEFLESMLNNLSFKRKVDQLVTGVAQKTLILRDLRGIEVILPERHLQEAYAQLSRSINQKFRAYENHQTQLHSLFSSLQQKAFNGEL